MNSVSLRETTEIECAVVDLKHPQQGKLAQNLQALSENKHATISELANEWCIVDNGKLCPADEECRCLCSREIKSWWLAVNCINGHHVKLGSGCKKHLCKEFGEGKVNQLTLKQLVVNGHYSMIDDLHKYTLDVMLDYYKDRSIELQ